MGSTLIDTLVEFQKAYPSASLSTVSTNIQYGYTAKSSHEAKGPKYLRITDIQDGVVDWPRVPHCEISAPDKNRFVLNQEDIVFARSGATVGKSFLIEDVIPDSVFASYLIRVTFSGKVYHRYGYYFFQSPQYWQQIMEGATGTGQPNFNGAKLGALKIPTPSMEIQRRIVERLDQFMARSKSIRDALSRVTTPSSKFSETNALLDRLEQSILAKAFRGELNLSAARDADRGNLAAE